MSATEKVLVGVTLPQFTADPDGFLSGVTSVEAMGADSGFVFDHLWPLSGGRERPVLECWTALSYATAATERLLLGTLVTRSSLRHPALLAKMALTVAAMAPGRLIVGIGSGDEMSREENEAFGIPYFGGGERIDQLASVVKFLRASFDGAEVTQHDPFTDVEDLPLSPRAEHAPLIWLGGRSEQLIELAARYADGWNAWASKPDRFAVDAASVFERAGERPIEPSWAGAAVLGRDAGEVQELVGKSNPALAGTPPEVAGGLQELIDAGARHLVLSFPSRVLARGYELLPRVLERLDRG